MMGEGKKAAGKMPKLAKQRWALVKKAVGQDAADTPDDMTPDFIVDPDGYQKPSEPEQLELAHGVEQLDEIEIHRHKNDNSDVRDIIKSESCGYLISFENGNLGLYRPHSAGTWRQDIFRCKEAILYVTYSKKTKSFVAVCDDQKLRILDRSLKLINIIPYVGKVTGIDYNEFTNEIVTFGVGSITVWIFRTAYTILIPKTLITDGISAHNQISCCHIEWTSSEKQRLFVSIGKNVRIFNISSGECIKHLRDCHNADISALLFYQPVKLLVTAGRDGSIKMWKEGDWALDCLFVGHIGAIHALSVFPFGPFVMSASRDQSFKTWSLDNRDEIDCQSIDEEVIGLRSSLSQSDFYCFTRSKLILWRVKNLYSPFVVLGSEATILKTTTHPKHAPRSYAICDDACVRIISPASAETITTMVVSDWSRIRDAEYMISEELLFVLLTNGDIFKCDTTTNPCTAIEKWTKESTKVTGICTSIALYEYTSEAKLPKVSSEETKNLFHLTLQTMEARSRILLFGGCLDGKIVVFDWETEGAKGMPRYSTLAHKDEVSAMCACPRNDQLATTGPDLCLKIWRVYPFAEEALAPLLMFNPSEPTTHVAYSRQKLCAVTQNPERASYQIGIFLTRNTEKAEYIAHDHGMDHTDEVTAMATCAKLRLIASASMDRSIRIWSENGQLIRILRLNEMAHSLCFSTHRGDLLVGMGNNIHIINHKQYLPQSYLYRLVAMLFLDSEPEEPIKMDDAVVKEMSADDRSRIHHVHTSYMKFMRFIDDIPADEQERREVEDCKKAEAFALFKARDIELTRIKEGRSVSKRLMATGNGVQSQANKADTWAKYMGLFYTRPAIAYPPPAEDEDVNKIAIDDDDDEFAVCVEDDEYMPPQFGVGFFALNTTNNPRVDAKRMKADLIRRREESIQRRQEQQRKEEEEKKRVETFKAILAGEKPTDKINTLGVINKVAHVNRMPAEPSEASKCLSLSLEDGLDQIGTDLSPRDPTRSLSSAALQRLQPGARRSHSAPSLERVSRLPKQGGDDDVTDEALKPPPPPVIQPLALRVHGSHYPERVNVVQQVNRDIVKHAQNIDNLYHKDNQKQARTLPIAPDGFLPNSVVVALYKELRRESSAATEEEGWKPKTLTEEQLAELNNFNTNKRKPLPPPVEMAYDEMSDDTISLPPIEGRTSILSSKLVELRKELTPVQSKMSEEDLATPPPTPPPEPEPEPVPVKKEKIIKPVNIVKYVAPKPKTPTPPPPRIPTPPPPTPPRPKTPLPNFILQFETHDWFIKCFPLITDETIPKPHTLLSFIEVLLGHLRRAHKYDLKQKIISAILLLSHQESFDPAIVALVRTHVLAELRRENGASSRGTGDEVDFLKKALQLLLSIQEPASFDVIAELMVQFVLAQHMFRKDILRTFEDLGVQDSSAYFEREMESTFNAYAVPANQQRMNLLEQVNTWLREWTEQFRDHIKSLAGKICRASQGQIVRGTKSPVTDDKVKGILKLNEQATGSSSTKSTKAITFVNDEFVGDAAEHVTPIEVINYFVDMKEEHAREMARLKALLEQQEATTKRDVKRNTVLSIPNINTGYVSLARLGETHHSKCHPERETNFASESVLPPIAGAKKPPPCRSLVMHMNQLYLSPFPDPLDELLYMPCAQSDLITLQTSAQKYFIPSLSLPPPQILAR